MRNYLDEYITHIDDFDLALYDNAKEALNKAMQYYNDYDIENYFLIVVEDYKCIAHSQDSFTPYELDKVIVPFNNERIYPMRGLITVFKFEREY